MGEHTRTHCGTVTGWAGANLGVSEVLVKSRMLSAAHSHTHLSLQRGANEAPQPVDPPRMPPGIISPEGGAFMLSGERPAYELLGQTHGGERVAVCFSGLDEQIAVEQGRNIRKNLLDPLQADVLLALTQIDGGSSGVAANCTVTPQSRHCSGTAHQVIKRRFAGLMPIAAIQLNPTSTMSDLVRRLEASSSWNATLTRLEWAQCQRNGSRMGVR